MRYLKRRRRIDIGGGEALEDPLSGVANLFDASVVFIVSMMIALFMAYNMMDLLNPKSEITITRKTPDGQVEIVTRQGKEIKVTRVTDRKLSGRGEKLGTAYRLPDGRTVYVPE